MSASRRHDIIYNFSLPVLPTERRHGRLHVRLFLRHGWPIPADEYTGRCDAASALYV